jgi:hypothetical protein
LDSKWQAGRARWKVARLGTFHSHWLGAGWEAGSPLPPAHGLFFSSGLQSSLLQALLPLLFALFFQTGKFRTFLLGAPFLLFLFFRSALLGLSQSPFLFLSLSLLSKLALSVLLLPRADLLL